MAQGQVEELGIDVEAARQAVADARARSNTAWIEYRSKRVAAKVARAKANEVAVIANRASDLTHGDKMGDMADTLCSANARIEHRIERNPKSSVLVAAAIGLAIGLVSRR